MPSQNSILSEHLPMLLHGVEISIELWPTSGLSGILDVRFGAKYSNPILSLRLPESNRKPCSCLVVATAKAHEEMMPERLLIHGLAGAEQSPNSFPIFPIVFLSSDIESKA